MKDTSSSSCISLFFCGIMALHIPDNRICYSGTPEHFNLVSKYKKLFKLCLVILFDFFFFFFNCSFECSCLSGWIYLLSFFFGFSVVASHWSKVEGFRCAVTQDCSWHVFAVLLTETETWQLACVSLWEHTWICFMTVWTRRHKTYFSIAKKFVLIHFLYCILWQLCRDKFMKVQEGPRAGKVPLFFCARMKVVGVINMWGVFCAVGSVLRHFL